ncbi:preprotein translocase subunit YajC [Acinetobacter rudis]
MPHMTHNYMLGLSVLVLAFLFFYTPLVYAFLKIRKQRKQNK